MDGRTEFDKFCVHVMWSDESGLTCMVVTVSESTSVLISMGELSVPVDPFNIETALFTTT